MIKIYHSPLSRSARVIWLAEEIGLDYSIEVLELFSDAMQHPDYLAVHPLGKVPAIDDNGFILWETPAIFDYLITRYSDGGLIPPRDTALGAQAVQPSQPVSPRQRTLVSRSSHLTLQASLPAPLSIPWGGTLTRQ